MLYDMMKDGDISGAQYLDIITNNILDEESEDVISENFQYNIPATINSMIPLHLYESKVMLFPSLMITYVMVYSMTKCLR